MTTKRVTFYNTVLVWEHTIALGDNPSCSVGPPIALGQHESDDLIPVQFPLDEQEKNAAARYSAAITIRKRLRAKHEPASQGPPITKLNYYQRVEMLKNSGFGEDELREAEREVARIQRQRAWSLQATLPKRLGEAPQRVLRKLRGQGTVRQRRTLVKQWYLHYNESTTSATEPSPQ